MIDVLFVVPPHTLLLDVVGPAEAFRLANDHRVARGLPRRFRLRFCGPVPAPPTSVGVSLTGIEPLPAALDGPTWVVVAGQPTTHRDRKTPEMAAITKWLHQRLARELADPDTPHRLLTICSGALLAARAGLLNGRECTTHHECLAPLRAMAPRAQVVDNRVFVVDGPVVTCAGITAGIDVALHLIAEKCGEALAATVGEDMVVYLRRSQRDPEQSPYGMYRRHLHPAVHRVQDAIVQRPEHAWTMVSLAAVGHSTQRHLLRLFLLHAHASPLDYLRSIRLERARQALEYGTSVTRAAEMAGFSSALQLRRAWRRAWGGSPSEARSANE